VTERELARLLSCPLFRGVELRDAAEALVALPHGLHRWSAGSVLLPEGSSYDELIVLLEGEAAAEMTNDEGKSVLVETMRAPEAVATAVLFAPRPLLPVAVIARTELLAALIPRGSLLTLCARFRPVLENVLADMGARLSALAEKLRALQFATLSERLADWLVNRASLSRPAEPGATIVVRLDASKERLASLFGVARPSLSRVLGSMESSGLIRVRGRDIEILDLPRLKILRSR